MVDDDRVHFLAARHHYGEQRGAVLGSGVELDEGKGYCVMKMTALSGVAPFSFKRFRSHTEVDLEDEDTLWEIVADWAGEESDQDENGKSAKCNE